LIFVYAYCTDEFIFDIDMIPETEKSFITGDTVKDIEYCAESLEISMIR